jgi:hypothetical protein
MDLSSTNQQRAARSASRRPSPRRWLGRTLVLLVALNLGLLGPLVCVIHCAIHQRLASPHESSVFLCSGHAASRPAAPVPPPPTPRALYELVPVALQLLPLFVMAPAPMRPLPMRCLRSITLSPPTPPPRPAQA